MNKLKITGIILIVISVLIFLVSIGTQIGTEPSPPEIKFENKGKNIASPGWPLYLGALALAAGVFFLLGSPRKKG